MAIRTPAQAAANIAAPHLKFYIPKRSVRPMISAITLLQERDDISGKFARRVGQNRRALSKADEIIIEERKDLTLRHAEKFPALDEAGNPHPKAGEPTPVYAVGNDGQPIFKKDDKGNNTEERVAIPDQYNLADPAAFRRDFDELLDEFTVVECPGFTTDDWNAFAKISGKIVDPLIDLDPSGPTTKAPEGFVEPAPTLALMPDEGENKPDIGPAAEAEPEGDRVAP